MWSLRALAYITQPQKLACDTSTWMDMENVECKKPVTEGHILIPSSWNVRSWQIYRVEKQIRKPRESRSAGDRGWGVERGVTANGYRVSFGGDESILKLDGGDGCTAL